MNKPITNGQLLTDMCAKGILKRARTQTLTFAAV